MFLLLAYNLIFGINQAYLLVVLIRNYYLDFVRGTLNSINRGIRINLFIILCSQELHGAHE